MMKIACIGEAMVELSLSNEAPDRAGIGFAGDTLNTAIYLKRCAPMVDVAYVTRLGQDRFSDDMLAMMQGEDLGTGLISRSATRQPGLYAISTDEQGERSFSYWRDSSAARELFADGEGLDALSGFDMIYFSAITLAILSQEARAALIAWLPDYRAKGGKLAFDSNHRPALWNTAQEERAAVAAVWAETDIALPGLEDEQAIFGDADEAETLSRLRGYGIAQGAVKRGGDGPVRLTGDGMEQAYPQATQVIDSTAAGDSFNGAYLAAVLREQSEAECLMAGHEMARRVIGAKGAILPKDDP